MKHIYSYWKEGPGSKVFIIFIDCNVNIQFRMILCIRKLIDEFNQINNFVFSM